MYTSRNKPDINAFLSGKPQRKTYDFRSDTMTVPTMEMLQTMLTAPVGDDVKEEDPTINYLQKYVAEICHKEDALFVPTGTMGNQLAIRSLVTYHYNRATVTQSILVDSRSHVYKFELGGIAALSQVQATPITAISKYLTADLIEKNLFFANDYHTPVTTIVSLENTLGGAVFPIEELKKIRELADKHNISIHMDGARIWNACVASGLDISEYTKYCDTVSMCLSKGLGAPVGSVLVGSKDIIAKARQYRKLFGGGMRQAGVLAACGLYAIEHNWPKMKVDHENTRDLYAKLILLGFEINEPETNIIYLNSSKLNLTFEDIIPRMSQVQQPEEPLVLIEGEGYVCRIIVHFQTPSEAIQLLVKTLEKVIQSFKK